MESRIRRSRNFNGLFLFLLAVAISCIAIDYFKLIEFYLVRPDSILKLDFETSKLLYAVIVILLGLTLLIPSIILIYRNKQSILSSLYLPKIKLIDLLIIAFLFLLTFFRMPLPDRSFDVINYHIFSQNFGFENNLTYNYFPGNLQTFIFPLGDRIYYIFRLLLGFRGGVLLNTFVLIIVYFQLKELLDAELFKESTFIKNFVLSLFALFAVSTEYVLSNLGVYMIDLLVVPFLLELVIIARRNDKISSRMFIYSCLLTGISISFKFSSLLFSGLVLLFIFLRFYKNLRIKTLLLSAFALLFPIGCYVLYNIVEVQNPLFPFFNNIFKSLYYLPVGWPTNFDPSFLQLLFWPIYILFNPHAAGELNVYSGRISLGFIISIAYILIGIQRKNSSQVKLGALYILLIYVWVLFSSGYIRYGLFVEVMTGLIIAKCLYDLFYYFLDYFKNNHDSENSTLNTYIRVLAHNLLLFIFIFFIIAQSFYSYYLYITNQADWSLRPTIKDSLSLYLHNLKMVGRDFNPIEFKDNDPCKDIIETIDVWVVNPGEIAAGYEKLLKNNIPILNISWSQPPKGTQAQNELFEVLKANNDLKSKKMYMLSDQSPQGSANLLERYGLKTISTCEIQPNFTYFPLKLIGLAFK